MDISSYRILYDEEQAGIPYHLPKEEYATHTMLDALYYYVCKKFPVAQINRALAQSIAFEIHGIYPAHAESILTHREYSNPREIPFVNNPRKKPFNFVRPRFFLAANPNGEERFVIAVTPGADYVAHYAEMLRYLLNSKGIDPDQALKSIRYPKVEKEIAHWTGLDTRFVCEGDIVVIGYVDELQRQIESHYGLPIVSEFENEYYTSKCYETPERRKLNFLGVKFSFWGNISVQLALRFCYLKAGSVLYVSKVGALSNPNDLYKRIFVPSKFITAQKDQIVSRVSTLANYLIHANPALDSGAHVSVATVLEETFSSRDIVVNEGALSIDNEVSQIANTIFNWNRQNTDMKVRFGCMHFATDYLHQESDGTQNVFFNLSNNRSSDAIKKKALMLAEIGNVFFRSLGFGSGDINESKNNENNSAMGRDEPPEQNW